MEFVHKSILLQECLDFLDIKPDGIYVDGTFKKFFLPNLTFFWKIFLFFSFNSCIFYNKNNSINKNKAFSGSFSSFPSATKSFNRELRFERCICNASANSKNVLFKKQKEAYWLSIILTFYQLKPEIFF